MVAGVGIGDLGFGLGKLGLAELDDGGEAEVVALLGEVEGETGLLAELLGDGEALVSTLGVFPGDADVARDAVAEVHEFQAGGFGL